MTHGSQPTRRDGAQRARISEAGNAAVLPLMVCVAALIAAALILATFATGLAQQDSGSSSSWSGAQGPPGAVGLTPDRGVLQQGNSAN